MARRIKTDKQLELYCAANSTLIKLKVINRYYLLFFLLYERQIKSIKPN